MKKLTFIIYLLLISGMIIISSCGRKKEVTSTSENSKFALTELAPADIKDAANGDWIIKQEMSDAEKLNPTVTNDASANVHIYIYIFEPMIDIDRVTYELKTCYRKISTSG